ncbi:hypothetical protein DFJ67_4854 [Asanoa ferruginea]|uniref:Uncharacterized protein n=1 Tax=Asanoa ferruginea TaxID=53367 RepID=A0A3D9ZQC1_9ACTN|nr:hypothetical protein [Asanoa ferruginea]REF98834.1 hypothetical protein DFJ67_4854 [Asanoa ferruginea]GIF49576.1 hypothetical protein Afe04nite_41150 [Asanoa ferruginea]
MSETPLWTIDQAMSAAEREWRRLHVHPADLAKLSRDLRDDLTAAATEGVGPAELIGPDVRGFARRLAAEAPRIPCEFRRLLLTALVGALPGILVGYAVIFAHIPVPARLETQQPGTGEVLLAYTVLAALVVASSLLTVWFRLRDLPSMGHTVLGMALLVPLAGLVVTPVTMGFAALVNYSNALPVVVIECGLVLAALGGAVVLARRWSLRGWVATGVPQHLPAS